MIYLLLRLFKIPFIYIVKIQWDLVDIEFKFVERIFRLNVASIKRSKTVLKDSHSIQVISPFFIIGIVFFEKIIFLFSLECFTDISFNKS